MSATAKGSGSGELRRSRAPSRGGGRPPILEWLEYLGSLDVSSLDIRLPEGGAIAETLRWLDVPEEAIPTIAAVGPDRERHPEGWWILERCVASLVEGMGVVVGAFRQFPELPSSLPGVPLHHYIHVFVATLPHVLAYHGERGISEGQSRAILGDLGRNVRVHEKRHGEVGLGVVFWITLHFRGLICDLGRLQFEWSPMCGAIAEALRHRGVEASPEEPVLSVHIPDYKGPLTPEAVDDAIASVKAFFARHFPEERYRYALCHSRLLDPQLRRYLLLESNFVQFQQRFELAERTTEADRSKFNSSSGPSRPTRLTRPIAPRWSGQCGHISSAVSAGTPAAAGFGWTVRASAATFHSPAGRSCRCWHGICTEPRWRKRQ